MWIHPYSCIGLNQNITGFTPQVLAALVDGTLERTSLNPPSGGWPTGSHFRVNFVQDPNNLNTIYAQSGEFNISSSTSTSTTRTYVFSPLSRHIMNLRILYLFFPDG